MDFIDSLRHLADRIPALKDSVLTEEATKNAFIYPFIRALDAVVRCALSS